ncbi:acyltransferase [Planctomycetota bacterium]
MIMKKNRDSSFDAFRGLAIIAVVAIHVVGSAFLWRYPSTDRWNFFFLITYCQLINFAVPAFLFISGYWSAKEPMESLADYKTFLTKRLPRILIPYLFWSLVWLGCEVSKTHDFNAGEIILKLFLGRACSGYYFIVVIVQFYIITPLLQRLNRRPAGIVFVLILSIIGLLALYLSRLFNVIMYLPASTLFYSWIIFYEVGLLAGNRDNKKMFMSGNVRFIILPAILVFLLISAMESMFLLSRYGGSYFTISPTKYSSVLYLVCVFCGFLFVREHIKNWPKFLVTLGKYSFGIYLIHIPVFRMIASIAQKSYIYSFQPLYQFTVVFFTVLICFVLIIFTRKLLPKSFCRRVLGF